MKNACLLSLILVLIAGKTSAQRFPNPKLDPCNYTEIIGLKNMNLLQRAYDLSAYNTMDTSFLSILYLKTSMEDTVKRVQIVDTMRLDIGERYSAFFSRRLYRMDSIFTVHHCEKRFGNIGQFDGGIYYYDRNLDRFQVVQRIPFIKNTAIEYIEPRPRFNWRILNDSTTIFSDFRCIQAVANYGGRCWKVWFAPDIPINSGPWKLSGLPGLILKAEDTRGEYIFEIIGISQDRRPIFYYQWKVQPMTKSQWLKYNFAIHQYPYNYVGNGGKTLFLYLEKSAREPYLDAENWTVPYNPIEFE